MGGFDVLGDMFGEVSVVVPDPARPTDHGVHLDREPGADISPVKDYASTCLPGIKFIVRAAEEGERAKDGDKDGCGCTGNLPPFD